MRLICWFFSGLFCLCISITKAEAYKRTLSPQGKVLFWNGNNISYHINKDAPPGLDATQVHTALQTSFNEWIKPSCTCLRFDYKGLTSSRVLGYDQQNVAANQNLVMFQFTSWQHANQAVAITSNIFNEDTGEIVAYDMEINSVNFTFSLDGLPRNGNSTMDLQNVVTHEVGHVIGLDHSSIRDSTMFTSGLSGETKKRDLHADDIQILCQIYPANGCKEDTTPPTNNACGCNQDNSPGQGSFVILLLITLGLLLLPKRFL